MKAPEIPKPKMTTWESWGVRVDENTWADVEGHPDVRLEAVVVCPTCSRYKLILHRTRKTGHCESCDWSFKLRGDAESGEGIVDLEEMAPILERWHQHGFPTELSSGVNNLDALYKPRRGEITVVTGYPGDGKSTFLKWYLIQATMKHNWKFAVFSPEDMPFHLYLGQLAVKIAGKPFHDIDLRDLRMAERWAANRFVMLDPPQATAEGIMAQVRMKARDVQGIVIDPWTEVEHAIPAGMREDQYLNSTITRMRRLARFLHVHVWIVVHPKNVDRVHDGAGKKKLPVPTLDDCAGGAMWKNKPDWGLCVHRPHKGHPEEDFQVDIHIQKARFAGFLGGGLGVERMIYDKPTSTYQDTNSFGKNEQQPWPLDVWKDELNHGGYFRGYFDNDDWTWPPRDTSMLRPIEWRGQQEGGWWHDSGKFEAFVDPGDDGWHATVRMKADHTSRRTVGPFQKNDEAFAWCERMLIEWDFLPDPRES